MLSAKKPKKSRINIAIALAISSAQNTPFTFAIRRMYPTNYFRHAPLHIRRMS